MAGPLDGINVVDFGGIGPGPFATMLLADMGAKVVRIDRPAPPGPAPIPPLAVEFPPEGRGKASIHLDMKSETGRAAARKLIEQADVLVEGFRPGVMERMGFGPGPCASWNPRLVFCRVTGWGQDGPLAQGAGHDLTYLALTGALHATTRTDAPPFPPANLLGDYAGGGLLAVSGILAALVERGRSGLGQVVDAAIVDGVNLLTAPMRGFRAQGQEAAPPGENLLDGGYPFNSCYRCADGRDVALAAIEEPFFLAFCRIAQLDPAAFAGRWNRANWPAHRRQLSTLFATQPRDAWAKAALAEPDACLVPVLDLAEALTHPHHLARAAFTPDAMPAPAPRFSRTPNATPAAAARPGADTAQVLAELGLTPDQKEPTP